ncbi:MAG: aminopeptidase P family protein [Pseudoflavonifractor sp.]|nr:aminopeptidase P family protein [Pseudoflavonifractor sp.]
MSTTTTERIAAFRRAMAAAEIDAAIVYHTDPHQSEYIADHWQVRRWLSGFTGSAGTLVITADEALLWTDSRYFLQAARQLEGSGITLMKDGLTSTPSIEEYLTAKLPAGSTVGVDGMLLPLKAAIALREQLAAKDIKLDTAFAPIDSLWADRPALPSGNAFVHDVKYAGQSAADKIALVLDNAAASGGNAAFISALDEIAWVLNIRSNDVPYNPVVTAFLYLSHDNSTLFIDESKIDDAMLGYLRSIDISVLPYDTAEVAKFLQWLPTGTRVVINEGSTAISLIPALGDKAIRAKSLIAVPKSIKNDIQLDGVRSAMERDGAALTYAFMEIEERLSTGTPTTEMDVAEILTRHRSHQPLYFDDSFDTIAGFRDHGAIVHYSATPDTDYTLSRDSLLLIDSGAQYLDGTTDITRTIALGIPTPQQRHDFTLVMKGHIALGTAIFPADTRGSQLDALARQFLWKEGLSYLHGTGHGVGHFLNVHEGPQNIRLNENPAILRPGMITSNEPGLYRSGEYGIRCENLVLTVPAFTTDFGDFNRFETLTLFPFDLTLFDTAIMTPAEIDWVNNYHRAVFDRLSPLLDSTATEWLRAKTAPLA